MRGKALKITLIFILIFICLIFICLIIYKSYIRNNISQNIRENIIIEYGEIITIDDILKGKNGTDKIKISPSLKTLTDVGKYKVELDLNGEKFMVTIEIKDTTPPTLEVKNLEIYIDEELPKADDFVVSLNDLSKATLEPIEIEKTLGTHEVKITAKDKYNNKTQKKANLKIKEDKEPPKFSGLSDISIFKGEEIDLKKNVLAFDEHFGNVEFNVDDSKVNYNQAGNYIIYYKASDKLGNETTETRKITIKTPDVTYMINNFPTYNQYPNFPNGCESIALYNLLKYYKVNVSPYDIVNNLKKGDRPYLENNILYGGNPEIEFVGNPCANNGYGVYQKPIIEVANKFKSGIIDYTGHSLDQVLELVKNKIPVQVWVSIGVEDTKVSTTWIYKPTGEKIKWIRNLHSVVIVGFNSNYVYVSDSYTGNIEKYNRQQFNKIYNLFGNRAIYYAN